MQSIKAVTIGRPPAGPTALGGLLEERKPWRTDYRGQILLVVAASPAHDGAGVAVALAELVACHSLETPETATPARGTFAAETYAWIFRDVRPVSPLPVDLAEGVYDVPILPRGLSCGPPEPFLGWCFWPPGAGDVAEVEGLARNLRSAREALGRAAFGLLTAARSAPKVVSDGYFRGVALLDELRTAVVELGQDLAGAGQYAPRQRGPASRPIQSRSLHLTLKPPAWLPDRLDVLVLDPNALTGRSLRRALGDLHSVRAVSTVAAAALEIRSRIPDALVCEYQLGADTSVPLFRLVARHEPQIRRVLYSATATHSDEALVSEKVVHAILRKPASRAALVAALANA